MGEAKFKTIADAVAALRADPFIPKDMPQERLESFARWLVEGEKPERDAHEEPT